MIVELKCPACGRFLAETTGYARAVCPKCAWEITIRSRDERKKPLAT